MQRRSELTIRLLADFLTNTTDFAASLVQERDQQESRSETGIPWSLLIAAGSTITGILSLIKFDSSDTDSESRHNEVAGNESDFDQAEGQSLLDTTVAWIKSIPESIKSSSSTVPGTSAIAAQHDFVGTKLNLATDQTGKDATSYVLNASNLVGVDPSLVYSVAKVESNLKTEARNRITGATGLMQILPSTWNYLIKKYRHLGFTPQDISDPQKNAILGAVYLKDISNTIESKLGRTPSAPEVYLGHFLGPTGALRFLNALATNPETSAASLFKSAALSNKTIFFDRSRPRTIAEVWQLLTSKVSLGQAAYLKTQSPSSVETAPSLGSDVYSRVGSANTLSSPKLQIAPVQQTIDTQSNLGLMSNKLRSRLPQAPVEAEISVVSSSPTVVSSSSTDIPRVYVRSNSGLPVAIPIY